MHGAHQPRRRRVEGIFVVVSLLWLLLSCAMYWVKLKAPDRPLCVFSWLYIDPPTTYCLHLGTRIVSLILSHDLYMQQIVSREPKATIFLEACVPELSAIAQMIHNVHFFGEAVCLAFYGINEESFYIYEISLGIVYIILKKAIVCGSLWFCLTNTERSLVCTFKVRSWQTILLVLLLCFQTKRQCVPCCTRNNTWN